MTPTETPATPHFPAAGRMAATPHFPAAGRMAATPHFPPARRMAATPHFPPARRMASRHRVPAPPTLGILVLLAATALAGCGDDPGLAEAAPPAEADLRPTVSAVSLTPATLTDVLVISGRLEPRAEVEVSTEGGGIVEEVLFDKGDRVESGQLLARINTDLLRAALLEAEADLSGTQTEFERARQLVEREAAPGERLTTAETNLKRAEARHEAARLRFDRSAVPAPASGVIVSRDLEPGEILAPGARIAVLHDTSVLRATIGIPETDIARFRIGAPAAITLDAYPDRVVEGRISWIAPNASQPGRNFLTEIEVPNRDDSLRSGLIVRARLERGRYEDTVIVSRDALLERDGILYAFVLEGGAAAIRAVELGPDEGNRVVVTSGLALGERLLVAGHRNLLDGEPVRVVAE